MMISSTKLYLLAALTLTMIGCHGGHFSVGLYDDDYGHHRSNRYRDRHHDRHHNRVVAFRLPDHVCTHDCHDHYWNGDHYVRIRERHHHGRDCGHHWNGKSWIIRKILRNHDRDHDHGHHKIKIKKRKRGHHDHHGHHD